MLPCNQIDYKETWHLHALILYVSINVLSVLPYNHIADKETWHLHVLILYVLINVPSSLPYNHTDNKETRFFFQYVYLKFLNKDSDYWHQKPRRPLQRSRQRIPILSQILRNCIRTMLSSVIHYSITSTGNIGQTVAGCHLESLGCLFWVSVFFLCGASTPLFPISSYVTEHLPVFEECI